MIDRMRVSIPEPGPLSDGGYRWVGNTWAVDLDRHGRAVLVVSWPSSLDAKAWRRGAKAAVARAESSWTDASWDASWWEN